MAEVGRPSKYTEEMLARAQGYFCECKKSGKTPFVEEIALELDVSDDTIVEWSKANEEFSATMRKLKLLQKLRLKQGALYRQYQPTTAIFLLKANHGLSEKEPDLPIEDKQMSVIFYHEEDFMREINARLAENGAGGFEGKTGSLQYLSQKEFALLPPTSNEKEPSNVAETIAQISDRKKNAASPD
jgi:hypothetical protein